MTMKKEESKEHKKLHLYLVTGSMVGHMVPLLPSAEELLKRGHSITFFHPTVPKFRKIIETAKLNKCASVTYHPKSTKLYEFMKSHIEDPSNIRPDVIVHDFFEYEARDLADSFDIPAVCIFPNLAVTVNPFCTIDSTLRWKIWCGIFLPILEAILARGLWLRRNVQRVRRHLPILTEQDIYPSKYQSRDPRRLIIGTTTPEFEFNSTNKIPDQYFLRAGPSLPTHVEEMSDEMSTWLSEQQTYTGRRVVYVAFGSMFRYTEKIVQSIQQQLLELGSNRISVIWSLADKYQEYLHPLSEDDQQHWIIESHCPQVALFRSCKIDIFVTHCGSNSVSEALLSAIPMVCCPGFADQNGNASRLARKGMGVISKGGAKGVRVALIQVLDNLEEMKCNAGNLKQIMQSEGGASKAVDAIESAANVGKSICQEGSANRTSRRISLWPLAVSAVVWAILNRRY